MLRKSPSLLNEFENKTRWSYLWRRRPYGTTFLMQGCHRRIPMHRLKFVTKESNKLSNFSRYSAFFEKELNVEKNKEIGVELDDVRWDDRRYLSYKCQKCGIDYKKMQSAMVRYRSFCPRCAVASPTVLGSQITSESVAKAFPKLLSELSEREKVDYVGSLSVTSRARVMWKCRTCEKEYSASVRSRTGRSEKGQAEVIRINGADGHCPSCRWSAALKEHAAKALKTGSFIPGEDFFSPTKVVSGSK